MGLFTKKRKEDQNATSGHLTAPSVTSPSRNSTSSNSRPAPVPASASPFLYGESHGPSFKLVQGRKRRDSDLSIRSSRTTAAAAPTAAASSGSRLSPYASRSDAGGSGFQRSFDSLPLPSKSKSTYAAASASAGPRHGVSPLRAEATEDGRSTSSKSGGRSTFGALFKKRPQHAHKPDSTASSSSQSTSFSKLDLDPPASSDFNLRSFRSGSSSSTTTTANTASTKPGPTPLQPSLQHQQSRLSTDAVSTLDDASLPAPSPAFAYGSSSPRNSRLGQSPGHRPMSPSQSSISVSQFNQAKAMRSGNASLRSASSVSSLNQMANNQPTPSSASPQPPPKDEAPSSGRPAPAQTPVKRHSQGPPLSRPSSSRLDLPLPTPSRVAPARPLPQRRTSSIDPTMDVYADYFSSPVTTPADDLFPAKHNFFGPPSRGHSPMPSSTAVNTLTSSPPKSDDRSLLPPAPIVDPEAATADQKRSPERPFSQRTLSGSSLLDVASGFGASLSTYLSSVGQDGEPAVAASAAAADKENRQAKRAERTKSRLMGKHAWGADSDSDEDAQEEVGSDDASSSGEGGALQMSTKRPQTSTTPRTPQAAPASAAWESDDAVIKREEARKQALLAQISPFTRSSYAPPSPSASTPQTTPKAPVVPKSASPFSARLQEAAKSAAAAAPPAPAPVAAAAPMPLHEENLEILNTANRNDSAVDDDDDDEAPLASIAAKSSHHRAQSELCFPSSSRMSFANSVMGGPPQMSMPFQQHFAQMGGSFMSPQPASSALSPQSSTPDLRLRTHSHAGQAKEKPSLSALVDGAFAFFFSSSGATCWTPSDLVGRLRLQHTATRTPTCRSTWRRPPWVTCLEDQNPRCPFRVAQASALSAQATCPPCPFATAPTCPSAASRLLAPPHQAMTASRCTSAWRRATKPKL